MYFYKLHFIVIFLISSVCIAQTKEKSVQPNIVIIFLDDSGWSDFQPFNKDSTLTPHVDQLAKEGCFFTNFYVPQAICSASRAALLTASYPGRTKVFGAHGPKERGLETIHATMGEVFKSAGYKTALFGKWHCGDQPDTRPQARGYDETAGLMYSNDMWAHHPDDPEFWGKFPLQYWKNNRVVIENMTSEDQKQLTKWYTKEAVDFIDRNKDDPFLLYVPHSMPHVPIYCGEEFEGKSGKGLYQDVVMELDWSVGQINTALKRNGLDKNTIVIFTSDNGPWSVYGNHSGKTPFREAKATSFDGGIRSATIIKYPGFIKENSQSKATFFSIDLLPTLCNLTGVSLPKNEIDGKNVWDLITMPANNKNPHAYYAISNNDELQAIMSSDGKWKLHISHTYRTVEKLGKDGLPGVYSYAVEDTSLYNMDNDPMETVNVVKKYPEVAHKLLEYAKKHRDMFYDD